MTGRAAEEYGEDSDADDDEDLELDLSTVVMPLSEESTASSCGLQPLTCDAGADGNLDDDEEDTMPVDDDTAAGPEFH